jgi:photosystem II stability/assembly factor-like uncharacterized protein
MTNAVRVNGSNPSRTLDRCADRTRIAIAVAALSALAALAAAPAAAGGWTLAGPPHAEMNTVTMNAGAPNVVVATRGGQMFRSIDAGATWGFVADVYGSACQPALWPDVVALGGSQGEQITADICQALYFSPDGGESWGRLSEGDLASARLVSANPADQRQLYVLLDTPALAFSADRLRTRVTVALPGPVRGAESIQVDWANGFVYCAVGASVYRTAVGQPGAWQLVSTGLATADVLSFTGSGTHLYALTTSGVYRTANQGGLWEMSLPGYSTSADGGAGNGMVAYAAQAGAVLRRTADGGQTWASMPALPGRSTVTPTTVAASPTNPLQLFALTNAGLFQSLDGGESFAPAATSTQLPGNATVRVVTNATRPLELYAVDPLDGFSTTFTADGGASWSYQRAVLPDASSTPIWTLWASGSTVVAKSGGSGGLITLYRSTDSGATWAAGPSYTPGAPHLLTGPGGTLYLFVAVPASSYFDSGYFNAYVSTDAGATWASTGSTPGDLAVVRRRADTGEFYAGAGALTRSTDTQHWTPVGGGLPNLAATALDILPSNPLTMYVGYEANSGPAVYKSVDGGTTWQAAATGLPTGTASALAIDPATPGTVFVGFATGGVYRSDDAGATWSSASAGLYDATITELAFSLSNPHRLYASTTSGAFMLDVANDAAVATQAVEYYYPAFDHYFVTALPAEIAALDGGGFPGWARTGETYAVEATAANGLHPICRFFSATFAPRSSHFYTPYTQECAGLIAGGVWQYEGTAWQQRLQGIDGACPGGFQPYYRMFNNGIGGAPAHRYSVKPAVVATMVAQGWVVEGSGAVNAFACVPR